MMDKKITLGGGCFWCTEAIFRETEGVLAVKSGFSGGFIKNPAYREVRTGRTGHAEVVQITYDPDVITYADLVNIHLMTHDPTTIDQQGADKGHQYRSIIFYENEEEKMIAEQVLLDLKSKYVNPIVTELKSFEKFYEADEKHQNYYELNTDAVYCQLVIEPKLAKYRKLKEKQVSTKQNKYQNSDI